MRVAVATDHAGLALKPTVIDWLTAAGHEVVDFGVNDTTPVDYPDVIAPAARAVAAGDCDLGVVLGGSGTGEQMVANKIRGIRCVEAADPVTARLGREHNDANVMATRRSDHRPRGGAGLPGGVHRRPLPGWPARPPGAQDRPTRGSRARLANPRDDGQVVQREGLGERRGGAPMRGQPAHLLLRRQGRPAVHAPDRLAHAQVAGHHARATERSCQEPLGTPAANAAQTGQVVDQALVVERLEAGRSSSPDCAASAHSITARDFAVVSCSARSSALDAPASGSGCRLQDGPADRPHGACRNARPGDVEWSRPRAG